MNWPYNVAFNLIGIVLVIVTVGGLFYVLGINPDCPKDESRFWTRMGLQHEVPKGTFCIKRPMKSDKSN